ncbi:MAG: hypothetical protein JO243_24740 [Solirubrobacterales bacterium]|nr:hypothetical protein [Solirubrobacterales bacterium]
MSITGQRHLLPLRSSSRDERIGSAYSTPRRRRRSEPIRPRLSGAPSVMGPPNHAPGVPVMGAASAGPHLEIMGVPDSRPRQDPMGGPDASPRVDLLGESDLTFVDSLFTQRRSLLQ